MSSLFSLPSSPDSSPFPASPHPASLLVWRDLETRSGAEHMALDEVLLRDVPVPVLRLYRWPQPEITIGFFTPRASLGGETRPVTRRWTGGGIVEHGEDVTLALSLPRPYLPNQSSTGERYRLFHEALAAALHQATDLRLVVEPCESVESPHPENPGSCFQEPVAWDVLDRSSGTKIAGGAQRRNRQGVLHQGSLRLPETLRDLDHPWTEAFLEHLLEESPILSRPWSDPGEPFWTAARCIASERYRSEAWNQRF